MDPGHPQLTPGCLGGFTGDEWMWDLTKLDCLLGRWSSNFCPTLSRPGSSPKAAHFISDGSDPAHRMGILSLACLPSIYEIKSFRLVLPPLHLIDERGACPVHGGAPELELGSPELLRPVRLDLLLRVSSPSADASVPRAHLTPAAPPGSHQPPATAGLTVFSKSHPRLCSGEDSHLGLCYM